MCAAIEARRAGAAVLLVDPAPPHRLGGNARHSRNIRLATDTATPWQEGPYPVDELAADLIASGAPDPALARLVAQEAATLGPWLIAQGVALERRADGNLPPSRRTAFFRGGGQALTNALLRQAHGLGVDLRQGWWANALDPAGVSPSHDGALRIVIRTPAGPIPVEAAAVVLASGGYGRHRAWLADALGPAAHGIANRGTPHQCGAALSWLLQAGAAAAGRPGDAHLVAVDARAPMDDAGIVSRVDGMPLGLVVGADGRRWRDEGAPAGPARFATWGQALAARPDPRGWLLLTPEAAARLPPMLYPPLRADGPAALARLCGIDPEGLAAALTDRSGPPREVPLPGQDGPILAIPMRPGISFTRHGVAVDTTARVRLAAGGTAPRLFAAGSAMFGAVMGPRYLSGSALTVAGIMGRIAGQEAAALAHTGIAITAQPHPASPRTRPPAEARPEATQRPGHPPAAPPAPPPAPTTDQPPPHPTAPPAPPPDPWTEARRALNICNTCGFCTALCAVFPAAKLREDLRRGDIRHLAHLCHDCGSCLDDCQYAPPHAFAMDLPTTLSAVRARDHAAGASESRALKWQAGGFAACVLAAPLVAEGTDLRTLWTGVALGALGAVAVLGVRLGRFRRASKGPELRRGLRSLARALRDALTLRYLGGDGHVCEDRHGPVSPLRRRSHHLLLGGLLVALVGAHGSAWPVAPATLGGGAMLAGLAGLELARRRSARPGQDAANRLLGAQLAALAITGLAQAWLPAGALGGVLPALHAGAVLGLALGLPFGKLGHGGWRALALSRHAAERAARRAAGTLSSKLDKPTVPRA